MLEIKNWRSQYTSNKGREKIIALFGETMNSFHCFGKLRVLRCLSVIFISEMPACFSLPTYSLSSHAFSDASYHVLNDFFFFFCLSFTLLGPFSVSHIYSLNNINEKKKKTCLFILFFQVDMHFVEYLKYVFSPTYTCIYMHASSII